MACRRQRCNHGSSRDVASDGALARSRGQLYMGLQYSQTCSKQKRTCAKMLQVTWGAQAHTAGSKESPSRQEYIALTIGFAIDFQPLAWRFRTWQPKSDLVMCTRVQAIWCISADAPMQGHIMARCRTAVCSPDATGRRTPSGSSVDVVLDGTGHGWWGRCCSNCMILCTWQSRWLQRQDTMNVQPLDVSA